MAMRSITGPLPRFPVFIFQGSRIVPRGSGTGWTGPLRRFGADFGGFFFLRSGMGFGAGIALGAGGLFLGGVPANRPL